MARVLTFFFEYIAQTKQHLKIKYPFQLHLNQDDEYLFP